MPAPEVRRRTVAKRILFAFLIVLFLFAAASTWSFVALRQAVSEAALLRQGYLPLALSLRDLVSNQDSWNSQLNHITTAKNPADVRVWLETALSVGRPQKLAEVEVALERALPAREQSVARRELSVELDRVRRLMQDDLPLVRQLFPALARGDMDTAQRIRDDLVRHGLRVQRGLTGLETRVESHVDGLVHAARRREHTALSVFVTLTTLSLLVGALMAAYARRVLGPLSQVTSRARAVAAGDLTVREIIDSHDEIGELSATFESMVRAISGAREKLLASERLAAIGKMAAHVTHEVRNPLSSIALNLDLLEEELDAHQEEAKVLVKAIGQEVARLSRLSDQYLSMAKRKAPDFEESDIRVLLGEAVSFMARDLERHGVELELLDGPEVPSVLVDPGQVRQAVFNLVRNAREAMPEGGRISVAVVLGEDSVDVSVADNGPGISPERVSQLFDPFYTTKDHGTGLGLAVTRQIMLSHGGRLEYRSGTPGGSVFTLSFPTGTSDVPSADGRADTEDTVPFATDEKGRGEG